MKHILKTLVACAVALCVFAPVIAPTPARAADYTFADSALAPLGEKGFKVITGTDTVTVKFRAVIPLASTVVDTITFPTKLASGSGNYSGDTAINGKTLAAGIRYPIFGNSIKLTSGSAIVILR